MNRRIFLSSFGLLSMAAFLSACGLGTPPAKADPDQSTSESPMEPLVKEMKVDVLASGLNFPEGPAFTKEGELWCTELSGGNLARWHSGEVERFPVSGNPNGLAIDRAGLLWVCDSRNNAIRTFEPRANRWETVIDQVDGGPLQAPNDLCFDPLGNLLFTCPNFMNTDPLGYVCCLTPDGKIHKIVEGFYRPNGLELSPDGKTLVVADTWQKALFKGSWDADKRVWSNPQLWAEVGGSEGPDGLAWGADGLIYQAIYGDGCVRVVDQDGQISHQLQLPGRNATNAAIDPSGKLGLVVTETEKGQLLSLPDIQPGEALFR